ncbi:MAG: HAMP domain-containing histidine kinase [Eubacterium sp.]|nr:HAMP domain-containing histidine kinase [Eubacterium sp.]
MKIFADRNNRFLFQAIVLYMLLFAGISALLIRSGTHHAAIYMLASFPVFAAAVLAAFWRYLKQQNQILEQAAAQMAAYLSGDQTARIDCEEEGQLYRLFHEMNSLAAVLNAHADSERKSKQFLKHTISDISHQLKTPLAALNIYNGLLLDEAQELPQIQEFVRLSEQELDRIETLVQNLLKLAKLDAGAAVFEKTPENVADMMKETEMHFAYRARQEQKEIFLSGDDSVLLLCDRSWMMEAVDNLVKNALDHTEPGGFVRISWKQSAFAVQIAIGDNGSGIHPEDLFHIFKRFYRSRFSQDTQGIGLGLPLAKMIVEAHNGTIEADSRLGKGTVFTLSFLNSSKL